MKKLAIIIPAYKPRFLQETLDSIAKQNNHEFTVYIGDDASPDSPEKLLEKYQGKFNFTYKKFNDNLGSISLVKQWERCIDMMKDEEWFMILGDDDVLGEKVVEEFYKKKDSVEKLKINVIKYATVVIDDDEWDAIQANAISATMLKDLTKHMNDDQLKQLATSQR